MFRGFIHFYLKKSPVLSRVLLKKCPLRNGTTRQKKRLGIANIGNQI